jgi:SOS response regulatory protein OraA/RecX
MTLKSAELDAAVAQALANLNQRLAGATKEDIAFYQSAVDLAKASLDATIADKDYSIAMRKYQKKYKDWDLNHRIFIYLKTKGYNNQDIKKRLGAITNDLD